MKLKYVFLIIIIIILISYIIHWYWKRRNIERFVNQDELDWEGVLSGRTLNRFYKDTKDMILWFKFDNNLSESSDKKYQNSLITFTGTENYDIILKAQEDSPSKVAFKFDGNTYIQVNNPNGDVGHWVPKNMSIAFWIYGYSKNNNYQAILSARGDGISSHIGGWMIYIEPNGDLSLRYYIGDTQIIFKITDAEFDISTSKKWNHIVYTYDENKVKLYLNGKNVKSNDIANPELFKHTCANLRIGAGANEKTAEYYLNNNTLLDDIRMYNRVITEGEIIDIMTPHVKLNLGNFYQDILQSDDLRIPQNSSNMKFEIWDDIVSNKNNMQRIGAPMLDNMIHDNRILTNYPGTARRINDQYGNIIDIKSIYSSNLYTQPMIEKSLQMRMNQELYNNEISLEDPINDAYLPYSSNLFNSHIKSPEENNNDYIIITLFKSILDRSPSPSELLKYNAQMKDGDLDETMLKINLINSSEYRRKIKLQSNDVSADIEFKYAKEDLISYISRIFYDELEYEVPKLMVLPLKDIFIYLQNNQYLFRAFLIHNNYPLFEKDVISMKLLTKSKLGEIFDKYFLLYDLKLSANDIKRHDIVNRKNNNYIKSGNNNKNDEHDDIDINEISPTHAIVTYDINTEKKKIPTLIENNSLIEQTISRSNNIEDSQPTSISYNNTNMSIVDANKNQDSSQYFEDIMNHANKPSLSSYSLIETPTVLNTNLSDNANKPSLSSYSLMETPTVLNTSLRDYNSSREKPTALNTSLRDHHSSREKPTALNTSLRDYNS